MRWFIRVKELALLLKSDLGVLRELSRIPLPLKNKWWIPSLLLEWSSRRMRVQLEQVVKGTQIGSSAAEEVVPTAAAEPLGGGAAGEGEPPEEEKED